MKNKGRDELEAEVARLLVEREREENAHNATYSKLVDVADKLATERAAHEATKTKLGVTRAHFDGLLDTVDACARNLERAQAAEARVAELERNCDHYRQWRKAVASLQQARVLIAETERACFGDSAWRRRLQDWLRAHPEPTNPEDT